MFAVSPRFLQSVFDENIQITPSLSNPSDYILTSSDRSSTFYRRRRRPKKRIFQTTETQTTFTDDEQENTTPKSLSERRSVPNMGTSQVLLRNSNNVSPKESSVVHNAVFALPAPAPPTPVPVERTPEPVRKNNPPRSITVRRAPNFQGYGFHIQYNRHFYLIHRVEPHSPAEKAGLADNDIICRVNNQSTNGMSHKTFVQIMNNSSEVTFLVQDNESFMTAHPELAEKISKRPPTPPPYVPTDTKSQGGLTRALQKLKSR